MAKIVVKLNFWGFNPLQLFKGKLYFSKLFKMPSVVFSMFFWRSKKVLIQRTTAYFWSLVTALFYRIDHICFMAMNNCTVVRGYEYYYLYKAAAGHCYLHVLAVIEFRGTMKWSSLYMLNLYGRRYPIPLTKNNVYLEVDIKSIVYRQLHTIRAECSTPCWIHQECGSLVV